MSNAIAPGLPPTNAQPTPKARGWLSLTRWRLVSGLILFVYIVFHFINHALGLWSVEAMAAMGKVMKVTWRTWPTTILLYGALAVHVVASLWRVYQRRSLRMPAAEWAQLVLGLAIPFLMVIHVMGTRYASARYGINDTYAYVLISTFVFSPVSGWLNAGGLVAAWVHSCIGIYQWARLKAWYGRKTHEIGLLLAVFLPSAALAGYLSAGRAIAPLARDGDFMGRYYERLNLPEDEAYWTWISNDIETARWLIIALIAGLIIARLGRGYVSRKRRDVTVNYVDGPVISYPHGPSLLEMSQLSNVPHASVCGGRGRCSTCRVRVLEADPPLEPPSDGEQQVLNRVRAAADVRLACQIRPQGTVRVIRLLPPDTTVRRADALNPFATGRERQVAVLFADLRDFTRTAEQRLPYDVVYLINQFSRTMGQAVEAHGGRIDKFMGDGFMALFGLNTTAEEASLQALQTAQTMTQRLVALNDHLANDLDQPLRMGMGLHTGSVILGDMGYGPARGLTAIGDTVNIASRLESATKEQRCALCVSKATVEMAGLRGKEQTLRDITVRGRERPLAIFALNEDDLVKLLSPPALSTPPTDTVAARL
ncbi:MAG: adenylate/guanylate cyclase domain-containing protein [Pseudomonadota bacterium]